MLEETAKRILRVVLGLPPDTNLGPANPLEVHDPKVGSLISFEGTTTADGAPAGATLVCTDLAAPAHPDFNGNLVIITSGDYAGQARDINGTTLTGTVTPLSAFDGQVLEGTTFVIAALRLTPAEVAAIAATLATHDTDIKALLATIAGYLDTEVAAILADVTGIAGAAMRGTDNALLAASYTAPDNAGIATLLTRITAAVALASSLATHDTDIKALLATVQTDLDNPNQYKANVAALALEATLATVDGIVDDILADTAALESRLTAARAAFLDEAISAAKVPKSTDWKGSFNWDTSAYTTNEQDISALFSTNLALDTRRRYSVKLDLTNVETDASFVSCYIAVKEKIDGANYRAIDRKTITKADIATTAEPGIPIDIPATSENIQITMQMSVALAVDKTIYYAVVKEILE